MEADLQTISRTQVGRNIIFTAQNRQRRGFFWRSADVIGTVGAGILHSPNILGQAIIFRDEIWIIVFNLNKRCHLKVEFTIARGNENADCHAIVIRQIRNRKFCIDGSFEEPNTVRIFGIERANSQRYVGGSGVEFNLQAIACTQSGRNMINAAENRQRGRFFRCSANVIGSICTRILHSPSILFQAVVCGKIISKIRRLSRNIDECSHQNRDADAKRNKSFHFRYPSIKNATKNIM